MALPPNPVDMASPITTRSTLILEIAEAMAGTGPTRQFGQVKVLVRTQGEKDWPLCLFASSTVEGIDAVINREADLAIVNPATPLALAYRGKSLYDKPHALRGIAVIPSLDQFVFAVKRDTGLKTFEEIGQKKHPLRLSMRAQMDHSIQFMIKDIALAAGFALEDIKGWGGEVRYEGNLPFPNGPKFQALKRGTINAIFDEACDVWLNQALDEDMVVLPLSEATVKKLEAMGYRRSWVRKESAPKLTEDILTIDFSGWPVFVREDAADQFVTDVCAALDARKDRIPWQGEGPLPIERMCRHAPDTPQEIPLHPAAEAYWRKQGYLP